MATRKVGMKKDNLDRMLKFVDTCNDPEQLRTLAKNARNRDATDLAEAAFRRLVKILPSEQPGTVEHDFWRTVHSFEEVLSEERGRTTRLSRTRQKVSRVGVHQTLIDWALSKTESEGFAMLLERGLAELAGEAIILRHQDRFEGEVVRAAQTRLEASGVDIAAVVAYR